VLDVSPKAALHDCLALLAFSACLTRAADDTKPDARYPYRTDFANANLPWYQLKPGEFPPMHSDRRITGELIEADFIHRSGVFRESVTGALHNFTLLPFASVVYLDAPADLRDVPLGTDLLFMLFQDENGAFTKAGTVQDDYTTTDGHSFSYRLDEARRSENKLLVTSQNLPKKQLDLGKHELLVSKDTRAWKGQGPTGEDKQISLQDLAPGDCLLANLSGRHGASPGVCTDIWVGGDTQRHATAAQSAKHAEFVKERGLPAWIDHVDGDQMTVTLLCRNDNAARKDLQDVLAADFELGKNVEVCVANDELRTYNAPTDKVHTQLLGIKKISANGMGNSGIQLQLKPNLLLEGFRQNHIVRIFSSKWKVDDMPYGETFSSYRQHASPETHEVLPKEYPAAFPFRTDYGNRDLAWYQLKPGVVPPPSSEHLVTGELLHADAANRTGQFRTDRTGEIVDFTLRPEGAYVVRITQPKANLPMEKKEFVSSVRYHDADASLADIPPGTHCRFHLYQDAHGAFDQASLVTDDVSWFALNFITYRIDSLDLANGILQAARQIPPPFNYNGDKVSVPDLGHAILRVEADTRVWKAGHPAKLTDLAIGDALTINFTGETADTAFRCREIYIGPESQALATAAQEQKHPAEQKSKPAAKTKPAAASKSAGS
jgi:hypothetical protein